MKFSLFTPTHNPKYIHRLEQSIQNQTFKDFEWIVVPNGNLKSLDLHLPATRLVDYTGQTTNIGELKHFACSQAQGEILVEVDHDDELTPDCLAELNQAFTDDDFVYSNCCEIKDGKAHTYNPVYGWKYRDFIWNGTQQLECLAFEPTPDRLSKIWYAPNHVRAWRKSFYDKIGGHNKDMVVCDDHDLVCRSYIAGNVRHIDKCLYVYHFNPGNTSMGEHNAFIQEETLRLHDKYIYALCEKWCDLNGLRKIDLCGGFNCPSGYESVDLKNANVCCDLNERWPFEDQSIGLIRAHDAIEHLKNPIHTMTEAYRCLADGGMFLILVPSTDGRGAFQDPTHVSFWNSNSFWYYTQTEQAKYIGSPVGFQSCRIKNYYPNEWCKTHNIVYTKADLMRPSVNRV